MKGGKAPLLDSALAVTFWSLIIDNLGVVIILVGFIGVIGRTHFLTLRHHRLDLFLPL